MIQRILPLLLATVLQPAFSPALASGEAERRINRFFEEITSLKADFTQQVLNEDGEPVRESAGKVQLQRPGRFRWAYEEPYEQVILTDGERLWIYDPELEQATVKDTDEALGTAPIMLLTERRALDEHFTLRSLEPRGGLDWVELRPKVQDTEFTRVELGLGDDGIERMRLRDHFGQTTVIKLHNVQVNADVPASTFEFDPPPGTDVIGAGR